MPSPSDRSPAAALRHDGTPTGCLCAIAEALARELPATTAFLRPDDAPLLFMAATHEVAADTDRAARLLARLRAKAGADAVTILLQTLIAMPPDIEPSLLHFIRGALHHGSAWVQARADPHVERVRACAHRVGLEIHRFKGLLRFAELASGRLLATFEPDHDIVMPLALHFRRRLAPERWLILDARRRTAASWDGQRLNAETAGVRPLLDDEIAAWLGNDTPSADEARCRRLWQVFHPVSIETRTNHRLQRRCLPLRYWNHLTEMDGT